MNSNNVLNSNEAINGNAKGYCETFSQQGKLYKMENSEVKRKWNSVNAKFQRDILRLERSLGGMDTREKSLATEWIGKLKADPPNLSEALARNHIVSYLLRSNKMNIFNLKPFDAPSAIKRLSKFQAIMPAMSFKKRGITDLVNNSIDNGEFIYKLPVPRDGAFFILHLSPNL